MIQGELDGVRTISAASVEMMTTVHLSEAILNGGFTAGVHAFRPGCGYGFNGAVFSDPAKASSPVGRGAYQWDGASGVWFWVDPENQLLFIGIPANDAGRHAQVSGVDAGADRRNPHRLSLARAFGSPRFEHSR
ncbi:MAG TPA: hypothetical protein VGI79_07390 [Caulobacteraceae bacterium]